MKPRLSIALVGLGLVIGFLVGYHFGEGQIKLHRQQARENFQRMMLASEIYKLAYSNNPAALTELLTTNEAATKR